jgi:hypothetical protein
LNRIPGDTVAGVFFKISNMSKIEQVKIPISGPNYTLARHNDGKTLRGANIGWVEWNDDGKFKYLHQKPEVGFSLMVDPHSWSYTWLTTPVTDIIEQGDRYIIFQTENSKYELTWTNK